MRYFCNNDLREAIREDCKGRTQKEWAAQKGVSAVYVSDFLNGRRDAGAAILKALGFEQQPYYRKASGGK